MWSCTGQPNGEKIREDWTFEARRAERHRNIATTSWSTDPGLRHTPDMWSPLVSSTSGGYEDTQGHSWDGSNQKDKPLTNPQCLQHQGRGLVWPCYLCGSEFSSVSTLDKHISSHGYQGKRNSTTQQVIAPDSSSLPTPVQTHPIERIFPCSFCEKNFTNKAYMKMHMRVHTGDKPYKCKMCDKAFSQHGTLKNHTRTHTGEKPFVCEFCDMRFTNKGNMITHTRIHTADKPYDCEACNKKFSQLGSLKVHMRKHTGERPFTCPMCNMKCITKGNLKTHLYTHTGEKPHSCDVCNKKFSQKGSLKTHMKIHNP